MAFLNKAKKLAGEGLKLLGFGTIANEVTEGSQKGNWVFYGIVGVLIIILIRR